MGLDRISREDLERAEVDWEGQVRAIKKILLEIFQKEPDTLFTRLEVAKLLFEHPGIQKPRIDIIMRWLYKHVLGGITEWQYGPLPFLALDQLVQEGLVIQKQGMYGLPATSVDT